jgi:hypothetical protein
VWTKKASARERENTRQNPGRTKPPQERLLRPSPVSARVGLSHRCSSSFGF